MNKKDDLGDRMKLYEGKYGQERFMPLLPICARLDGKCFRKFTKGLDRPYDKRMSDAMVELTKYLVEETGALVGYTQSDEISLILYSDDIKSQVYFDGRVQKMVGDLAAMATLKFNQIISETIPSHSKKNPRFDCRCWQVPNKIEAANTILWREKDATKNSISMAASHHFSHKSLLKKSGKKKQDMLMEKGINWNDYPDFFKRGTFIQKRKVVRKFTAEEMSKLPPKHKAHHDPDLQIERNQIAVVEVPPFTKVVNRVEFIFEGEEPTTD